MARPQLMSAFFCAGPGHRRTTLLLGLPVQQGPQRVGKAAPQVNVSRVLEGDTEDSSRTEVAGLGDPWPDHALGCREGGGAVSALLTRWDFIPLPRADWFAGLTPVTVTQSRRHEGQAGWRTRRVGEARSLTEQRMGKTQHRRGALGKGATVQEEGAGLPEQQSTPTATTDRQGWEQERSPGPTGDAGTRLRAFRPWVCFPASGPACRRPAWRFWKMQLT